MTKQEQFVAMVQTAFIVGSATETLGTLSTEDAYIEAIETMAHVIYASGRLPDDLSAAEAATAFCKLVLIPGGFDGETLPEWMEPPLRV